MESPVARSRSTSSDASDETTTETGSLPPATVAVTEVTTDGPTVECALEYSDDVRPFFGEERFTVSYGVDVSNVPEGVLTIPVLSQLCPVAWAVGADVRAPTVDERFVDSLETVGTLLNEMYPSFVEGGRVFVDEVVRTETLDDGGRDTDDSVDGPGLLFTGGVNSLSAYARHRDEDPTLIAIRAWHVGPDEDRRWQEWQGNVREYADRFGADAQFVDANVRDVLNSSVLSVQFTDEHDGGWYSAVGDGLGLLGLTAPLTVAAGVETLYFGARHWDGFPTPDLLDHWDGRGMPWGSHPDIDEAIGWAETSVVHDGFELTRQERVEVVADLIRSDHPDLPVWACESPDGARNCNQCEECFRTAVALAVAGLDPNDHGLVLDEAAFDHAIECFEASDWLPDRHHAVYWQELRDRIDADTPLPVDGDEAFREWIQTADFDAIAGRSAKSRAIRAAARAVPLPVFTRMYNVYSTVRN